MYIDRNYLKQVTGADYYDGSVLHSRFAYKFLKKDVEATGDIIAFVAPMEVTTALVDLEDALNQDYIYSESAINFIIELPNVDLYGAVCFQRLFNTFLGSMLCQITGKEIFVDGDDIMVRDGEGDPKKASVSIAHTVLGASLIHTGINIDAGDKAPDFAYSTNLTPEQVHSFISTAITTFYTTVADIFVATTKVIS
jgi:hypothetical protein